MILTQLAEPLVVWKASLQSLPGPVWILCAGAFVNRFGSFVVPFLALYMTRQGYALGQISMALAAYGLGHFAASVLGGYLADRIGRRKTIAFSMVSAAVALMLLSQAESFPAITVLAALVGLTGEFYRPACGALLADLVPASQRVTAFAAYRLAINAGFAFGPATAGFVAEHSFFWLFAGDALTSMIFGVVAWVALPHGVRGSREQSRWSVAWHYARQDTRLWRAMASWLAIGLVFFQLSSTFGLHVIKLGYSKAAYGLLISLNGLLIVLFELPLTAYTRRLAAPRVMAVGYLLIGGGFALNALALGMPGLVAAMVIFTVGEMIAMPVASAFVANLAPDHLRGRYMGISGLVMSVALMVGPALGLLMFEWHPSWLWTACGFLGLSAAWIITREDAGSD